MARFERGAWVTGWAQAAGFAIGTGVAVGASLGWLTPPAGLSPEGFSLLGVVVLMATAWLFETLPLAATALAPVVLLPMLDIQDAKAVSKAYTNSTILLLMGSFFLARGVEHHQIPQRLADRALRLAKGQARRLVYGLVAVTAVLSMWLSNTATTLVMVTVGMAVVAEARRHNPAEEVRRFQLALLLGVAYAANLGGMGTPIGTAPNAVMLGMYDDLVGGEPIAFATWMVATVPLVLVLTPLMALALVRVICRFEPDLDLGGAKPPERGPVSTGAKLAMVAFGLTALGWIFRRDLDVGAFTLPGWSGLLGMPGVDDASVAIAGCLLMFALPDRTVEEVRQQHPDLPWTRLLRLWASNRVLSWEVAREIPWFLIILFGGGLALAGAFEETGLSGWLGGQLAVLEGLPTPVVVLVLCLGMSLLTELTSNTATTTILLPVLVAAATALELDPLVLMWPAALCASAAFILPIATPPNAIAAGEGDITIPEMARVGVWINALTVLVVTLWTQLWLVPLMGL